MGGYRITQPPSRSVCGPRWMPSSSLRSAINEFREDEIVFTILKQKGGKKRKGKGNKEAKQGMGIYSSWCFYLRRGTMGWDGWVGGKRTGAMHSQVIIFLLLLLSVCCIESTSTVRLRAEGRRQAVAHAVHHHSSSSSYLSLLLETKCWWWGCEKGRKKLEKKLRQQQQMICNGGGGLQQHTRVNSQKKQTGQTDGRIGEKEE